MFAVQIIFGFVLSLTIPMSTSATELPYGQLATNGFRNQAQVAYVKPPREFKALKPTTITVPNEVKQVLDELFTRNNTKALMVVRNSQIIYERYSFGVGKRNTPLGFSIAKSLTALIVGRAICDGYINSINDPIKKYIPSLSGTSWGESTVKNVLQMSSGAYKKDIKYNGHKNTELMKNIGSALFGGVMNEDFIDLMKLHDDKAFASGIYFNYNNFDTIALGLLVEKSAGLPFQNILKKQFGNLRVQNRVALG